MKSKSMSRKVMATMLALGLLAGCQTAASSGNTAGGSSNAGSKEAATPVASFASVDAVNNFLNTSGDLGPGSIANQVAIIPINHVNGPGTESDFYAYVSFKYVARDYIKYQISYISCTCREASVNLWQSAYVELSLPESKKVEDSVIKTISYDKDPQGHYTVGHWGDSDPIPNGTTYEQIKKEYLPYYIGKTLGQISGLSTIKDIDAADYKKGEGRENYTVDSFSGASVSTNNIIRMLNALGKYHATDEYFTGKPYINKDAQTGSNAQDTPQTTQTAPAVVPAPGAAAEMPKLPAPVDTTKTYKATKDATEPTQCTADSFAADCSSINTTNLKDFMGRSDVLYIDLRNYEDFVKKHFRNFESIPFFAYIYDKEAGTNPEKMQLYGGDPKNPVPVYNESDTILKALFPKDKTIFLMCQSGGRVKTLMEILKARGWDMSKIYNVGGMAQYTAGEYREFITDTPELTVKSQYSFEGLTKANP